VTTVFLDTVGLIALWDADDQWHAAVTTTEIYEERDLALAVAIAREIG